MNYRNLDLTRASRNDPTWLNISTRAGHVIAQAYETHDGRWVVATDDGINPSSYGLDSDRTTFPHMDAVSDWAEDLPMKRAKTAIGDMSLTDLNRLRSILADTVTARAALADVDTKR